METFWLAQGRLLTARGIRRGAVLVVGGRIAAIRRTPTGRAPRVNLRGAWVAPGLIDLHVWGPPAMVARESVRHGTTAFLTTLGPEPARALAAEIRQRTTGQALEGAVCLGIHLEGPFVNPQRAGALPRGAMRRATVRELARLRRAAAGRLRMVTLAPELPGTAAAIRWCRRQRVVVSLGHTTADARTTRAAVRAGARAVTHIFNAMPPMRHRQPALTDVALTDDRLTTMVIADGIHVAPAALRLLVRAKGPARVALVTDAIRHQACLPRGRRRQGWPVSVKRGAYYLRDGTLAGSRLTMMRAVANAVRLAGVPLAQAVQMASAVPARLLGLAPGRGTLSAGARADLVVFDDAFRVQRTVVGGRTVYARAT